MVAFCAEWIPKWNPMNVCSYHLQEAGATPAQEIAYSLATAVGVLDAVRESGQVPRTASPVFASISFFVNAGIRFVEETCKMRAFTEMWDRIGLERYGVTDEKARRFRYGVQVNSLGLTEAQPENNVQRIVLEMLGVTLSKRRPGPVDPAAGLERGARPAPPVGPAVGAAHAAGAGLRDRPAGVRRPLRRVEGGRGPTAELVERGQGRARRRAGLGGAFEAIDELKGRLVRSHAERIRRIEDGELTVVGVNRFTETAPQPARRGARGNILKVDPALEAEMIAELQAWRAERDSDAVKRSLDELRQAAETATRTSCRPPSTWPTPAARPASGPAPCGRCSASTGPPPAWPPRRGRRRSAGLRAIAERVKALPGGPPRLLVAKPGLDGHSNGAEQIAVAARDAGMEVIYQGIRLTPEQIAAVAVDEDVDVIGLSILSGSHLELVPAVVRLVREGGVDAPIVAGGIIPEEDRQPLLDAGVAAVYTPKDFELWAAPPRAPPHLSHVAEAWPAGRRRW